MNDKYPITPKNSTENELTLPDFELITEQIFNISCLPEFTTGEDDYKKLFDRANTNRHDDESLDDTLTAAGYYKEESEWTSETVPMVRLGMMTPRFLEAQTKLDRISLSSLKSNNLDEEKKAEIMMLITDLVDFNAVLREVIELYPEMGAKKLANFLQGNDMAVDAPESHRLNSERRIGSAVNGARGEVNFKRIVTSPVMEELGIEYLEASPDADAMGIDCRVRVILGKGRDQEEVIMPVDVKSTIEQVESAAKIRGALFVRSSTYAIKDNALMMWSGVDLNNLYDKLVIDSDTANEKAVQMAKLLRLAALDYHKGLQEGRIAPDLGYQAIRAA